MATSRAMAGLLLTLALGCRGGGQEATPPPPTTQAAAPAAPFAPATPAATSMPASRTAPAAAPAGGPSATTPARAVASAPATQPSAAAPATVPVATAAPASPIAAPVTSPVTTAPPATGAARAQPKGKIALPAKLGTVTFDHGKHAGERKVACATCHHPSRPANPLAAERQACRDCHTQPAAPPMKTSLQAAFHDPKAGTGICIDCHRQAAAKGQKAPLKCMECHKR